MDTLYAQDHPMSVGKGVEAAGKAWSDTAVQVANRDQGRLGGKRQ
jgi:hypothetical protein